jgi:hypothetical protein
MFNMAPRTWLLCAVAVSTIVVMLDNHYTRDMVGALEKQMESDLGLSTAQYSTLNSLYFMPNVIIPLFTGYLCEKCGGPARFLVYAAIIGAIGNVIFSVGADSDNISLFFLGRFMAGCVYEIIDTIPIIILGPLFKANWGLMVGILNGSLRVGTVLSFSISPIIYRNYGVLMALWLSAFISIFGVFSAIAANVLLGWVEPEDDECESGESCKSEAEMVALDLEEKPLLPRTEDVQIPVPAGKGSGSGSGSGSGGVSGSVGRYGSVGSHGNNSHSHHHHHGSSSHHSTEFLGSSPSGTKFEVQNVNILRAESFSLTKSKQQQLREKEAASRSGNSSHSHSSSSDSTATGAGKTNSSADDVSKLSVTAPLVPSSDVPSVVAVPENAVLSESRATTEDNSSIIQKFFNALPFRDFGIQYYLYLMEGVFLFGAMVPFWFLGSKFLQINYDLPVETADFYMTFPEGFMVIIAPALGIILDFIKPTLTQKMNALGLSCLGMTASFLLLAYGYTRNSVDESDITVHFHPLFPMVALGSCYAFANSMGWDVIVQIVPDPALLAPACGLGASALNVLPSLVPYLIVFLVEAYGTSGISAEQAAADPALKATLCSQSNISILVLAVCSTIAGTFAIVSGTCPVREYTPPPPSSSSKNESDVEAGK